jgi:hypothetical protein
MRAVHEMSISREQALAVFHQRHPAQVIRSFEIADSLPDGCAVYACPKDCWFVRFHTVYDEPYTLGPSRLVAVSKTTGEILFDGSANDEG